MKTIQLSDAKAKQLYSSGTPDMKILLEENFDISVLAGSIIDRTPTLEAIFKIGGKTLEQIVAPNDTKDEAAYKILKFGIAVLNENRKVDHSDSSQDKYEPRFIHRSGLGLSYYDYACWYASTCCGPRLCYLSYDLMMHGIKVMADAYNDYLNS